MKTSDRTTALRRELVATASAAPYLPRRRIRGVLTAIAAFGLAGALSGGAVSAMALASSSDQSIDVSVETMAAQLVGTHAELFGTPFILSGQNTTVIDVGRKPDGATALALALHCVEPGTFEVQIDGRPEFTLGCDEEATKSTNGGSLFEVSDSPGRHEVTIASDARYVVWVSWADEADDPAQSPAQQQALADGVVTADEYSAGFDRFAACMAEMGSPVIRIDRSGTVYDYSITEDAVSTGLDVQCYVAEFEQIDMDWQIANQDTSASTQILRDCLAARGIEPAYRTEEVVQQLRDAGVDLSACRP